MRSGQVAAAASVNLQTLRYYERRGLLSAPDRTLGGHRTYPAETVTRLRTIKAAQHLGFTLSEISELLSTGLRGQAAEKLAAVEARIAELSEIAETLRAAIAVGCDDLAACATAPACPLPFAEQAKPRPINHP